MRYGYYHQASGVCLRRDIYGQHFSDELKTNYQLEIWGEILIEDEDPQHLAKRLFAVAKRLEQVARFLSKIGQKKSSIQGRSTK